MAENLDIAATDVVSTPKRPRSDYIDILTVLATFCVVWLHSSQYEYTYAHTWGWKESVFVECIAYWAVPVFFMNSGVNLFNYRDRYSTRHYVGQRIRKAVIPFLAWLVIAYIVEIVLKKMPVNWSLLSPHQLYNVFITQEPMPTYWFFLPLFAIYAAMPVLSLLREYRAILWYMVIAGALTYSILPMIMAIWGVDWNTALEFPLTGGGYLIFPILGYLFSTQEVPKRIRILIYITGSLACAIRFIVTVHLSDQTGSLDTLLYNYLYLPGSLLACAVFLFVQHCDWQRILRFRFLRFSVTSITSASLGIYLIHYYFIRDVWPRIGWTLDRTITRTVGVVAAFLGALLIISLLRKIPGVRRIVP